MRSEIKISIIITAYNYGKFITQALNSAINQNYSKPYEIIIINDGSTDNTLDILNNYKDKADIKIINTENIGLAKACNLGINKSQGEYIIRLDADDYFDENILLVESSILDARPDIGMVYPDYFLMDHHGNIMDYIRLQKANDEVKLFDRSPLAAGALYRKTCYDSIGGYDENLKYQEDYDFWLRFVERYNVYNVNLPLLYYRKHQNSMSTNSVQRMKTRQYVKNKLAKTKKEKPEILAIIPAKENDWTNGECLALTDLAGKPVISYSIEEALKTEDISRVIVSTESSRIADKVLELGAEIPFMRPKRMTMPSVSLEEVMDHTVKYLFKYEDYMPDYVVLLQINSPLRKSEKIQEAIDTIKIHDIDTVISVTKDISFHWKPGAEGLKQVIYKGRLLRKDKETIYRENGSIYLYKTENILKRNAFGTRVGHIEMFFEEALRIYSGFDFWMCEKILMSDQWR